jgi:TRAP-type C4-dicarboxylate transport system substrate-binding protein
MAEFTGKEMWEAYKSTADRIRATSLPKWEQLTDEQQKHMHKAAREMNELLDPKELP